MKLNEKYFSKEIIEKRIDGIYKKSADEILKISPYRVEIQPTTFCNRMCSFCSHSVRNKTGNELQEERVTSIVDQLADMSCGHVSFSGGGEPFEWRTGDLCQVIRYTAERMDVTLTTNGDSFWDDNQNMPQNLELAKYCSNIIINTPDVDTDRYKNIVKGKCSWEKTEKILKAFLEHIRQNQYICDICCVVVVSKLNFRYLDEIDKKMQEIGVNRIYYKMLKAFENNDVEELSVAAEELVKIRKNCSKNRSIWLKNFLKSIDRIENYYCEKCWTNMMGMNAIIDPNGNVFICTPTVGIQKYILGNVNDKQFKDLWESSKRMDLINLLNRVHNKKMCPKECRMNSHNALIEDYLFNQNKNVCVVMNAGVDDVIK